MRYSLIIPVYNEEETIQELYKRCSAVLDKLKGTYEIIFVNDGSTDTTRALLLKLRSKNKRIKIINFSRNFGHQVAVNAGMRHSSGEYVAIIDGDLQDPPEILPKFFAKLEKGYDVVYGTRKKRKESFCKRFLYNLFYRSLQAIVDLEIPLDSGDFCVMKRHIVDAINLLPERNRYIRGLRSWVGGKQIGIDYKRNRRYKGKSKYTVSKLF
ncbi:MAG: glycosyltransferase family 2 protein, partial [Candidatus Paceibacterota bacterium]